MPDPTLQQTLKKAQQEVKQIDQHRERLAREVGIEEHKLKESLTRLKELGVLNAASLSIEDLEALQAKTQRSLEANLATVNQKILEANAVLEEYEAVTAQA